MSETHTTSNGGELAHKAAGAVQAIRENLAGHGDDDLIETNVRSLRHLAELIAALNAPSRESLEERKGCDDPNCMGRAVDGIKLWVPADHYRTLRDAAKAATDRLEQYRAGLEAIAKSSLAAMPEVAMFCDWEAVARKLQGIASDLLSPPARPEHEAPQTSDQAPHLSKDAA